MKLQNVRNEEFYTGGEMMFSDRKKTFTKERF